MTDTNAPERIWIMPEVADELAKPCRYGRMAEYIRADLANPAPREDGYSAGVRAAAEELNEACDAMWNDHDRVVDRADLGGFGLKEKHVRAISEAQQRLHTAILALLDAPALPDARAGAVEPVAERLGDCASANCSNRAEVIFERGGIRSHYCPSCYMLIQRHPTPACTATDGPASACVYRAPGLGTAADWERG